MIVKIQVPIVTSDPEPKALIYNKDRSYRREVPITDELKQLMQGMPKRFAHVAQNGDTITIIGSAQWQDW